MKARIETILLALLLLSALPNVAQAQYYYTNSYGIWSYTPGTGTVAIAGLINIPLNGVVVIPDTINGYPVTTIGNSAFDQMSGLTKVTIGTNAISIGSSAFNLCYGMKSITIGKSVTNIGESAFDGCWGLTNIAIPNSVASLGNYAFQSCFALTNVMIGSGITSIGSEAFSGCNSLINISVAPANSSFSSVAGVLFDKSQTTLIEYPGGKAGSYSTPSSVTSIGSDAFEFCSSLTGVTIPGSVISFGDFAFSQCTGLASVAIPDSVTSLGLNVFDRCTGLTNISVDPANPTFSSMAGVLFDRSQMTLIEYPCGKTGSYSISSGVNTIGDSAFSQCTGLTGVIIPDSVTSIGVDAFAFCTSLTSVTIGSGLINSLFSGLGSYAFSDCPKLAKVYIRGNSPTPANDLTVFSGDTNAIVYYQPDTTGWGALFDGLPTWNPQLSGGGSNMGVQNHQFGFSISGNNNLVVVVEACTNVAGPVWLSVSTNTLAGGTNYFSDPQWTNYPARFYRLSAQ